MAAQAASKAVMALFSPIGCWIKENLALPFRLPHHHKPWLA